MNDSESRVLIVADGGQHERLAKIVARAGAASVTAPSGAQAIAELERESFELVLLDSVPEPLGLIAKLSASDSSTTTPVLLVTAACDSSSRVRAYEAGATDVLTEPVEPSELACKVRALVALARAARLAQSQKMEALSLLAGGIAHDFNNILAVILSFAGFASEGLSPGEPRYNDLNEVVKAANRAARLTRQLLTVTSQQPTELEPTDLNRRVSELSGLVAAAAGPEIGVTVSLGASPAVVELDPAQFDQVLLNLVVNAREAMPRGGRLDIRIDSDSERPGLEVRSVRLVVTDSGVGMDERTQKRIFEPFFTTKEKGKGTGLGLATCFGIVEAAGGNIRVSSKPAQGSTFTVEFPLSDHLPARSVQAAVSEPRGQGENVLLVEDEATLLRALVRVFEGAGYRVHAAADGVQAKRKIDELGPALSALVTDVIMPGIGGPEVAKYAAGVAPNAVIFLTSGYLDGAHDDGEFPILWKPIPPRDIARTVAEALSVRERGGEVEARSSLPPEPKAVLVVEDDPAAQQALSRLLTSGGFAPRLAGSLAEARRMFATQPEPDLVLCDLSLPDGSGTELLSWIQTERPNLRDKTFVLTGSASAQASRRLIAGGSFPVLSKLTPPAQLLKLLGAALPSSLSARVSHRPLVSTVAEPKQTERSAQRERVLSLIEDPAQAKASTRMLEAAGFAVTRAATLGEATKALEKQEFSALLVDGALPEPTEYGWQEELRKFQLPTVVLGSAPARAASAGGPARLAEYLMKPFSPEALKTSIRGVIDAARAARIRRQLLATHHGGDDFQADLERTAAVFDEALEQVGLAFQPIVRSENSSVFGFEALLRCAHSEFGSPTRLLAAAQVLGRQADLGRRIRAAVSATLREHPGRSEVIFVNIDPAELGDGMLTDSSDPLLPFARRVVLEISERAALFGADSGLEKRLARLREHGYRLALDDMGQGYAGLSSIDIVRPDIVKIDTSLVRDIQRSPLKRDIVVSVLQAALHAGIIVVAEGVESVGERKVLFELGCDLMQGYLFAMPGPAFPEPNERT